MDEAVRLALWMPSRERSGHDHEPISLTTETVEAHRVLETVGKRALYELDGEEVGPEEFVAGHYRSTGWNARVVCNEPWLALRDFLFMEITHAREGFEGGRFRYLNLLYPQNYNRGSGLVLEPGSIDERDHDIVLRRKQRVAKMEVHRTGVEILRIFRASIWLRVNYQTF